MKGVFWDVVDRDLLGFLWDRHLQGVLLHRRVLQLQEGQLLLSLQAHLWVPKKGHNDFHPSMMIMLKK